ncbi:T9SS type A sorting domain-containing protein [Dyadobacter sp. 3J3]|uniref:T9SS type A sorting domain-containing protein n=1 Tax=Dyadobacter sp. 3J3 TaxID=2606600 RepID=UPI00135B431D|nr:T9SS type A sorting domain-containing protein [Dyadobacter sp. 3J3]
MFKVILSFCLCYIVSGLSHLQAQQFDLAYFDKLPHDKQLFGRDSTNFADIIISGTIQAPGYSYISIVKYRNNTRNGYLKSSLFKASNNAPFSLNTKINAELAEYAFEVYACKSSKDSSLIVRRNDVVAGDFYIIYGQSNAVSWEVNYPYRNEYARTYGSAGGPLLWGLSNELTQRVGIFGIEFQRRVAEKYQIPTCIINGSAAGASVVQLTARNENNHSDPISQYGALLNGAQQTGLIPFIKGMFYWQGENEASGGDPEIWGSRFEKIVSQWKEDYPATQKIYVFQLPLFGGGAYDDRIGVLREQQRTLETNHPIIQSYAALGAPEWNGFHYGLDGYLKIGQDLAEMAGYFHYGQKEKITSPNLKKVFYSSPQKDEITMVFEDYQEMVYPNDTLTTNIEGSQEPISNYSVKDFFYLNKEWQKLKSGRAEANKIIVKLKEVGTDSLIKYLPSKYHHSGLSSAPWVYIGPFLKNTKGFRAFAFHHQKIAPYTDLGAMTLSSSEVENNVVLTWNQLQNITGYILERFDGKDASRSHEIIYLPKTDTEYTDLSAKTGIAYTYKIRGYSDTSESGLSSLEVIKKSGDNSENLDITVYPNPVTEIVNIISNSEKIHQIQIFTKSGSKIKTITYSQQQWVTLDLKDFLAGEYFLQIQVGEKYIGRKVMLAK